VIVIVIVIVRTDRRTIDRRNGRSRAPVETEVGIDDRGRVDGKERHFLTLTDGTLTRSRDSQTKRRFLDRSMRSGGAERNQGVGGGF
jgi:hypothetical protein